MTITFNSEQLACIEAAASSPDNLLIEALAGAAKTTTLVEMAGRLRGSVLSVAFNKKIADEMAERMPKTVECRTLNSLGHRILGQNLGKKLFLGDGKLVSLLKETIEDYSGEEREWLQENFADILQILKGAKNHGHVPDTCAKEMGSKCQPLLSDDEFFEMLPEPPSALVREVALRVLRESWKRALGGYIDYADQLLLPTCLKMMFPIFQNVLVDEAQDLSELNHRMLEKLVKGRIIAVGDTCQPAGTLVSVVRRLATRWAPASIEQVPIEKLTGDERLLGYNGEGSFMFNRTHSPVRSRPFYGRLITANLASGEVSTYTDNHHCYASFAPLRDKWALYLMRKGPRYRIGRCKMEYSHGSGPTVRATSEGADAYWILKTFDTEREVAIEEAVAQAQFGIPDITFVCPGGNIGLATQEFLEEAWCYILASVNLEARAAKCLANYGRMMEFPLWEAGGNGTVSLLRPMIVRATNLMDGCLMLPYTGDAKILKSEWQPITLETRKANGEPVYSLKVSDNHLYVADGVVTHNCQAIYAFRGAHTSGMPLLAERFNMRTLHLSTTFRCPEAVCAHVLWHVPRIRSWEGNPNNPGEVRYMNEGWGFDDVPDGSAIICRNNAPLFTTAIRMLRAGRRPQVWGNDIAAALVRDMEKLGPGSMRREDGLRALAAMHREKEAKLRKDSAKANLADRIACIRVFIEDAETLAGAITFAQTVLNASGKVDLCTGHKSKGHEWNDVFFLDEFLIKEGEQEDNLRYVIATRAKKRLTYLESGKYVEGVLE